MLVASSCRLSLYVSCERLQLFNRAADRTDTKVVDGKVAFQLYDTYGFPLDLTLLMAEERGFTVDKEAYHREMLIARERSRQANKGIADAGMEFSAEQTTYLSDEAKVACMCDVM